MTIAHCIQCEDEIMVPPGVSPKATVRCPLCDEDFVLGDALKRLPPLLIVVDDPDPPAATAVADKPYKPKFSGATSTPGVAVDTGDAPAVQMQKEGAKPRRAPRPTSKRPPKKKKSALLEIVKIVVGGVVGIGLAIILLWYLPYGWQKDPFSLAPKVYDYAPWIVPTAVLPDGHPGKKAAQAAADGDAADGEEEDGAPQPVQFGTDDSPFGPPGGGSDDGTTFGPPGGVADSSELAGNGGGSTPKKPKPKKPKTPVDDGPSEDPVTPIDGSDSDGGLAPADDDGIENPFITPPDIDLPSIDPPVIGEPEFKPPEEPGVSVAPGSGGDDAPLPPVVEFGRSYKPKKATGAAAVTAGVAQARTKYQKLIAATEDKSLKAAERITLAFDAYVAACELAATSTAAAVNDNGPTRKELTQASKFLNQIAGNAVILTPMARICDKYCDESFEWPGASGSSRPTDGVLLIGKVTGVKAGNPFTDIEIELTSGAKLNVLADGEVTASAGDQLVAYALKVDSPEKNLKGYKGPATEVYYSPRHTTAAE